jgi:hypothetical protein
MRPGIIMLLLALASEAQAGCDARSVTDSVKLAEDAFVRMDGDGFDRATLAVEQALGCQTEALSAIQIAAVHRVQALESFFEGDEPTTVLAFQSLLATMPGYELPLDIAPVGHPLRHTFDQAKLFSTPETFLLPEPADGWLTIDGRRTIEAPAARPFVFQRFDPQGEVQATMYVTVGVPVPPYPEKTEPERPVPAPAPVVQKRKANGWLTASGLVLAAGGGVAYGLAFPARAQYDAAVYAGDEPTIRSTYTQTNVLTAVGVGAVAAGTGLVLVGVF